jgi:ribosomal protein S18 acetylase RimI-like enzyme
MITIEQLTEASASIVEDINKLLPQLRENPDEHTTSLEELETIVHDDNIAFIVVKDDSRVIGMASLYILHKFSKDVSHVEDVVVDDAYRGQGLGEKLMRTLIEVARTRGIKTLTLTSRPERIAGNKLYQKLGFEQKITNVYRMKL